MDLAPVAFGREARRLKLDTLVRLRWLAVTGQCVAVALVRLQLGYPLPFGVCLTVIAISAAVNVGLGVRHPASHRLGDDAATVILGFDILQLAVLLYLTGGLQNPFAVLFLAPVLISAASLSPLRTIGLGLLAAVSATVLARFHLALPWTQASSLELPILYVVGIWTAILLTIAFTGAFAYRIAEESRQLGEALAATEFVLAREQHLTQLDGLAAAAAHELGTPLATIRLVAKELDLQATPGTEMAADIQLLRSEVERCRLILSKLTSLGSGEGEWLLARMSLGQLVEEVVGVRRVLGPEIRVAAEGDGPEPECRRSPGLLYGLGNIVDNAADFARTAITVEAHWSREVVGLVIRDDGPGFPTEVLLRVGEPYVTTRGRDAQGEEGSGLGLGLFIAKTLIERSGAQMTLSNAPPPAGGAVIRIAWPRDAFSRGLDGMQATHDEEGLSNAHAVPI